MKFELSQTFFFDAAHTLDRQFDGEASRRIHGHTYHAQITVAGLPNPETGMVVDLEILKRAAEEIRVALDHRFLDDVEGLGPATLESLCVYIWRRLVDTACPVTRVQVARHASGDACTVTAS